MLLTLLSTWKVASKCLFNDQNHLSSDQYQFFTTQVNISKSIIKNEENVGYGIWMKYMPFYRRVNSNTQVEQLSLWQLKHNYNYNTQFIFSLHYIDTQDSIFKLFLNLDEKNNEILYRISYIFKKQSTNLQLSIPAQNFEGQWIMFYLYFDVISIQTTLYIWNEQILTKENILDIPFFKESMQFQIGGQGDSIDLKSKNTFFSNFQGLLSNIFTSNNILIFNNQELLNECVILSNSIENCQSTQNILIPNIQEFDGSQILKEMINTQKSYLLSGWIKLNEIFKEKLETVIIRISLNNQYQDDKFIGDKVLYLKYFQHKQQELNGFQLTTYSYDYPTQTEYTSKKDDTIQDFNQKFSDIFLDWHFIQYEFGTLSNNGQPLFQIYSIKISEILQYTFNKQINHFTQALFNINVGGDKFSQNLMLGQISNLSIQFYCNPIVTELKQICHYTCLTCFGPNHNNCFTCSSNSNRVYSDIYNTCDCQQNYLDTQNINICQKYEDSIPTFDVIEIQLNCDKIGYNRCDSIIECEFGYFNYKNKCIQCPKFQNQEKRINLFCANCYLFPNEFSLNPLCYLNLIKYDFNEDYTYEIQLLANRNSTFYILYEEPSNNFGIDLKHGFYDKTTCLDGYYSSGSDCLECQESCQICQGNSQTCLLCFENAYLNSQKCLQTPQCKQVISYLPTGACKECNPGYSLIDYQCFKCGENCGNCDKLGNCLSCDDPKTQYITLEGKNCATCQIQYCLYCFQQIILDNKIITSTLDLNFYVLSLKEIQIYNGCARCQDNYFYNELTMQCQLKCDDIEDQNLQNECNIEFEKCKIGIIQNSQQHSRICLIGQNGIQQYQCQQIPNCVECILEYDFQTKFCIVCESGYYSQVLTGQCSECNIDNCLKCVQQYSSANDGWKWDIRAFYKYFMNADGNHSFGQFATNQYEKNLEIKCLECQQGYLLYKNECIVDCKLDCLKCEIINSIATCKQCKKLSFGQLSSIDNNGQCLECPLNCNSCYSRIAQQISNFNPYFIQNSKNERFSRICFDFQQNENINYFYDSYFQKVVICNQFKKCYKKATITQKVFCSQQSYQQYLQEQSIINYRNLIFIDKIFSDEHLQNFETLALMNYLNEISIRKVELKFLFMSNKNEICVFPENIIAYSTIAQNVFSSNKLSIVFEGTNNLVKFVSNLYIYNFTTTSFNNLIIEASQNANILINNLNQFSELFINNCEFTQINENNLQSSFKFNFDYPSMLTIENITLSNLRQLNSIFFNLSSKASNQQLDITIINLNIKNSIFQQSCILNILDNYDDFQYQVKIQGIQIENAQFLQSSILNVQSIFQTKNSSVLLQNIILINSLISQQSILFNQTTIIDYQLNNVIIQQASFQEGSIFIKAILFKLSQSIFKNIALFNSTLISNGYKLQKSVNQNLIYGIIQIDDCEISDIQYDMSQAILQIINQNLFSLQILITGLKLMNSQYTIIKYQDFINSIQYESALMYFECDECYFQDIEIIRGFGYPEITIMQSTYLSIKNFHLKLQDKYHNKTLFNNLDCIIQQSYNHNAALLIEDYISINLDYLLFENCIVFDSPLILISGQSLLDTQFNEVIALQNSIFTQNILLITQARKQSSILSIISQQKGTTNIFNVTFNNNYLNEYYQDVNFISTATLYFSCISSDLQLKNIRFFSNLATNTTNSILYIKSNSLQIINGNFSQNNIINYTQILGELLFFGKISDFLIDQEFQIQSYGGNGYIDSSQIYFSNIILSKSLSIYGGGFYIITQNDGIIQIENSQFRDTVASLSSSFFSMGGCFYINSQSSSLNLMIKNTLMENSFSRNKGGAIYIIPSLSQNHLNFIDLKIVNCYSIQNSFLSYSLAKANQIISQVTITNTSFFMTQDGFENFLSQIDSFESDVNTFQIDNPLIYIQYGNVTFDNIVYLSIFISYLIHFEQCEMIKLTDIEIQNSTYLFQPLIIISMNQELQSYLLIQNMLINNITQFAYKINNKCRTIRLEQTNFECPKTFEYNNSPYLQQQNQLIKDFQLSCNYINFMNNQSQTNSLIQINQIYENQTVRIQNLTINLVECKLCTSGVILFDFYQQIENQQIQITNSKFLNSECGLTGCVSIYQNSSFLSNSSRLLQQYNYDQFDDKIGYQIQIQYSEFMNNSATYGGSVFVQETQIILKNCKFYENTASYGGAVYFISSSKKIAIFNCLFTQNQALVAGGIFLQNSSFQQVNQLDVYLNENNSSDFGNDISEKPRSLTISLDNLQTYLNKTIISQSPNKIIEQIIVKPYKIAGKEEKVKYIYFPSGQQISNYQYFDEQQYQYIAYNLTFRILALDKFNKQEKNLLNSYCNLYPSVMNITSNKKVNDYYYYLSYQTVQFNETSGDFNLDDLIIIFNPNYPDEIVLRILINCSMIDIPIYDDQPPFQIISQITDYSLILDIKTFDCQVGEYLNKTSGGCIQCDASQNQYSVTKESSGCQFKDDNKINKITAATLQLRQTYWRAYQNSLTIENCYHLENNCQGGWFPGDDSCALGHIGGLCEQCDLYNIRNQGHYYSSNAYSCGDCAQIVGNIIVIIVIVLWTLLSIALSVQSTVKTTQEFIIGQRLKCFGVTTVFTHVSTAILIKLFTNYLQIISTIASFQLEVPSGLSIAINSIGNPIQQGSYSLDCFLISISQIEIIYFRLIWGLIMAICYIFLYFSYGFLVNIFKIFKFYTPQITTTLIYVFIYFQPNLISGLMSLISYREISDIKWVQGNVSYLYNTNQHIKWLITFCIPLLLIFGITIPLNLWYGLYRNRFKLDTAKVRQIWGYLFNEYKLDAYFWETIKILEKEIILIVLIFYEDYVPIKASLVFLVLFAYSLYTTTKKPYMTGKLNEMDSQVTIVCSSSIILGSSIYSAQKNNLLEIQWPFYIIIGILNTLLAIKIISQIIFSYFTQLFAIIEKFKDIIVRAFPKFMNLHPRIHKLLQSRIQSKQRVKDNFAKIKQILIPYVRKMIEFKKQNNYLHSPKRTFRQYEMDYIQEQYSKSPEILTTKHRFKTSSSLCNPQTEPFENLF